MDLTKEQLELRIRNCNRRIRELTALTKPSSVPAGALYKMDLDMIEQKGARETAVAAWAWLRIEPHIHSGHLPMSELLTAIGEANTFTRGGYLEL